MSMQAIGPLMIDIEGLALTETERALLSYGCVGGLILFSRNYESLEQLEALITSVRSVNPNILISVDHEGGRVQRFRDGFTRIPPMGALGDLYQRSEAEACQLAKDVGWLFASELMAFDIDFSFAPVLDRDHGVSEVIGDRAFSSSPETIVELASSLISGMNEAGMAATGKHFPGHGAVAADSHVDLPVDERPKALVMTEDTNIFKNVAVRGLQAVMPAHVIYRDVDVYPAGFSKVWLQDILRQEMGFDGVIFSDDLGMAGAASAGTFSNRATAALEAGCDMVLVCNDPAGAQEVANFIEGKSDLVYSERLSSMRHQARSKLSYAALKADPRWLATREKIAGLVT